MGVFQDTSPWDFTGASTTGTFWIFEFAFAIATACPVAFLIPSDETSLVEAKPQVPFAITLIPSNIL